MTWRCKVLNQASTRFSQEEQVGMKWKWRRGWASRQAFTLRCRAEVVSAAPSC